MNIFLSVPFSSRVDERGDVEPVYRKQVMHLITGLRAKGHTVFCSLEYTGWRIDRDEFAQDFLEIDKSDTLVVLLEQRVSAGVQIESGYAFAKGKTLEIYQIGQPAWSNVALSRLANHEIREVKSIDEFVSQVIARN